MGHPGLLRVVEVDGAGGRTAAEGLLHRREDGLEHHAVVLEFDLGLGGVDVDVYGGRVCLYVNKIGRSHPVGDKPLVGFHHGLVEIGAAEIAAVDEEKLVSKGLAGAFRAADVAVDAGERSLGPELREFADNALSQHVKNPEFQCLGGAEGEKVAPVGGKGEADVRPRKGDAGELLHDVTELHGVGLQELPAGRHVVEQVPDREGRARRGGDLLQGDLLRSGEDDLAANFRFRLLRPEGHLRHGGY